MNEKQKTQSPIAWVLGQTGDHGGRYILSVILAVIGVGFSVAPYFVVIGIVKGLMEGQRELSYYLTRCLIMAALWLGRVLCHALSTGTSHRATFAVLGEIRKQRISIARAMMKDAPVIFLDEATANVDPENENELMQAIQALTAEKTVVMIAHRLKTVEHADQILVVDRGRIVQQGTHEELMCQDGIYRSFIGERREAASWKVRR